MEPRGAEARRALVTFEMMQNGDMMKPYLHGHPYFNKPPLYNWVLAFFFTAFGSMSEWVLRLPGVLSLVLTSLVFYLVGRPYLGVRCGWSRPRLSCALESPVGSVRSSSSFGNELVGIVRDAQESRRITWSGVADFRPL